MKTPRKSQADSCLEWMHLAQRGDTAAMISLCRERGVHSEEPNQFCQHTVICFPDASTITVHGDGSHEIYPGWD